MGYYVMTTDVDFTIKAESLDRAYRLLCELNARDELKRGRQFPATEVKPASSRSVGNPNTWFSWMPWDYDVRYGSAAEILEALGFSVGLGSDGSIHGVDYDDKTGDERHFLKALAPVVEDGSYICWKGEDWDDVYRYVYRDGTMGIERGGVEVDDEE